MKRALLCILCLVSVLAIALSLGGCSDAKRFTGDWESSVDLTGYVNTLLAQNVEETTLKAQNFTVYLDVKFTEDGVYTYSVNTDKTAASLDALSSDVQNGMVAYIESTLSAGGYSMTVDEFLAISGNTRENMTSEIIDTIGINGELKKISGSGKYEAEDGKLFVSRKKDIAPSETEYLTYEPDGEAIKLSSYTGAPETDDALMKFLNGAFPQTLIKK